MSFRDIDIKSEYRTPRDNVINEFFVPFLSQSKCYKRAVGFFSSSALLSISKGITSLIENGGKIQLIASPRLSKEDVEAINKGYEERNKVIERALLREFNEPKTTFEEKRLNLLAHLIANNVLDIKIAFTQNHSQIGIYHEKLGLLIDADDNVIAFSGSINETQTAFVLNYEVMDVFWSWGSDENNNKVMQKKSAFEKMWNNQEDKITILDFPEVVKEKFQTYKKEELYFHIEEEEETFSTEQSKHDFKKNFPCFPEGFSLHDYQKEAVENWKNKNYCGIFDMATGTGKTYTGLGAITELYKHCEGKLAVIISCPYQHLVDQWVEDIKLFNIKPIIGYACSPQKDWKKLLIDTIRNQKTSKLESSKFFCFVCTNATYSSEFVQMQLNKIKCNTLLIVDEAHNFGSERLSSLLLEST